eukprot:GHRQ01019389.1.p1 GENE.GHRQ01019389.1~~GHRQ01019389.1.p1  ORF type:complete len:167 (+),score=13.37 GHRQ01019389.1:342-842(+)
MLARGGAMGLHLFRTRAGDLAAALPSIWTAMRTYGDAAAMGGKQWHWMVSQGHQINPCNSKLHPAVTEAGIQPEGGEEVAVQVAYTPKSHCFGCGPSHPDGLHLESKRIEQGLEARVSLSSKYCAFPGTHQRQRSWLSCLLAALQLHAHGTRRSSSKRQQYAIASG